MKNQTSGIGEYSAGPTGQGCLWTASIGVMVVLVFSYLGTYAGYAQDPLDHVENAIAGISRPISTHRSTATHAHRRRHRRVVYQRFE